MSYGDYRRRDYSPPQGQEEKPIEVAMQIFVSWARANNRNYFSDMVKQNLAADLSAGVTPEQAVRNLIARAPR
ncbi:MAG: hypothetical protein IT384_09215 [Deltaproteobacteria bacterium]|nr:hypothetical protein [Deltaproteobacteria bacterium]